MDPITIVTANLDFALGAEAVKKDLQRIILEANAVTFQEAKNVDVDFLVKDPRWHVFQNLKDEAKRGTGVAFRKPRLKPVGRGRRIGVTPHGRGLLTRYITWVDIAVKDVTGEETIIRLTSVHLPPKRYWSIYPFMLANIYAFVKASPHPVIIGGDWNKLVRRAKDLQTFARRVGGAFYGFGIDGFLVVRKNKLRVLHVTQMKATHSDHHPVRIDILPL